MLLWSPSVQQVVDVPDDEVQAGIASGEFQPFKGKVNVINPEGVAGAVDAENLSDAFKAGYTFETAEDQAKRELREEYDDPMFAGIMGSLRGTTLGMSDVILAQGEGGNERAEALRVTQEGSPVASTLGEIAGAVAPALVTGGGAGVAGGAARGGALARAAGATPAGLAARAGRGAERLVGKQIAKLGDPVTAVGRMAARGAEVGVGGAIEGAAYGAGQVLSENALMGDDGAPLTAQQLVAGAGLGALVGGGAGVVFGGGLQGLSELSARNRRVADGIIEAFESSEGVAADPGTKSFLSDLVAKGGEWNDNLGGFLFNHPKEDIRIFTQKNAQGRWNIEVAFGKDHHKVRELMLDEITNGYSDLLDIVKRARIESGGELKIRGVAKNIGEHIDDQAAALRTADPSLSKSAASQQAADSMLAATAPEAQNFMRKFVEILESIDQMPPGTMDRANLIKSKDGLLGAARQYMKEIDAIVGTTPGFTKPKESARAVVELFDTLDRVKQRIGNPMRKVMKTVDPTEQTQNIRRFLGGGDGEAGGVYDEFRRFLERDDLWGKAAAMQREVNEGASRYWRWLDHADARRFATRVEKGLDDRGVVVWDQVFSGDRAGFKRFQNALGSGDEAEMAHFLMGSTDDLRNWVGAIKKNYDITGKGSKLLDDAEGAVSRFQKALDENKKAVTVQNQGKRLVDGVNKSSGGGMGLPLRGGTLGFVLGGGPGAIVGALAEQMFHPVKRIERIAKLQAAKKYFREKAQQVGLRMAKKITSKKAPGKKLARIKGLRPGAVAFFSDFSTEGAPPKSREDRVAGFKRVRQEIVDIVGDPEKLNARLARTLGESMTVAPNVSAEIVQNAMRGLQYLAQHMPTPPGMSLNPERNLREWVPSGREVADFESILRAIDDPLSVFDDLVDGTLSPAGAEAARVVHAELIQGGVTEVLARLAELDTEVPRADMLQLSMLSGVPLTWDMKPQTLLALQANYAEEDPQQPKPRLPTPDLDRMAEDTEARSEKLAEIV